MMKERQLSLFASKNESAGNKNRYKLILPLDALFLGSAVAILLLILSFSLGVERGKKIASASIASSQAQDEKVEPLKNIRTKKAKIQEDTPPQEPIKQAQEKFKLEGLFLGIRGDEEGSRSKERVFSVRGNDSKWDYKNQAPELWDQYQTSCEPGTHVRINPLLHWREIDVWKYIQRENIPLIDLYFAKDGKRYRSLGCYPCTSPVESDADTIEKIIEELENSKDSERLGRAQDQESEYSMQKLRAEGYM